MVGLVGNRRRVAQGALSGEMSGAWLCEMAGLRGRTALMEAADEGYADAVQALLDAGADRNARDRKGETALDKARREHRANVVSILQK